MFRTPVLSLLLAGLLLPASALACVNAIRLSNDKIVAQIDAASKRLDAGDFKGTIDAIVEAFPDGLKRAPLTSSKYPAVFKAVAITSIAVVRSGDTVGIQKTLVMRRAKSKAKAAPKAGELQWATERLDEWLAKAPEDPSRKAWVAEAQWANGKSVAAKTALEALAKADLLTDAFSWRVLAELRAKAGDAKGGKAALTRCKAASGDAAFCALDPGLGGS